MGASLREFLEIFTYREFLRNLVIRDIKVRYKRSVLGFLWVMVNPLLMMLILNMVFSQLFTVSTQNYISYLLTGIILWNFFSQSTSTAVISLLSNSNLIKKIYVPKAIFPLSVVISALVNFLFSLIPLFLILFFTGTSISHRFFLLPLVVILVGVFSFGVSLIVSTLTVFFHDTRYIYEVLLLAWMYATPIFYPESIVPEKFSFLLTLNPLYYFLGLFRGALFADVSFLHQRLSCGALAAVVALLVGWVFYYRTRDRIIYHL